MEKEFVDWYNRQQRTFNTGSYTIRQIAYAAWREGKGNDGKNLKDLMVEKQKRIYQNKDSGGPDAQFTRRFH